VDAVRSSFLSLIPVVWYYNQKNIRRRVYDALNVLMAMKIIEKEKKEIRWKVLVIPIVCILFFPVSSGVTNFGLKSRTWCVETGAGSPSRSRPEEEGVLVGVGGTACRSSLVSNLARLPDPIKVV
jgi:hypothetical protein